MKNIHSYIFLALALVVGWVSGFSTVHFPDAFAKRGALPSIDDWFDNRVR